jgi:DNA-binding MarR family transcriptional regulator
MLNAVAGGASKTGRKGSEGRADTGQPDSLDGQVEAVQAALWGMLRLYSSRRAFAGWSAASGVLISQPAFDILGRVEEHGPVTLGELGRLAHMDPSAVGRQVRSLEELGLVERTPGTTDRRVVEVCLTPRGKEVRQRVASVGARHLADELATWPESDRQALATLLPKLVTDLRGRRYELEGGEAGSMGRIGR